MTDRNRKSVIGMVTPAQPNDVPTVTIGIPDLCDQDMREGLTQTIDLRRVGIPCTIMIYRGENHAACVATLEQAAASMGAPFDDQRSIDNRDRDLGVE